MSLLKESAYHISRTGDGDPEGQPASLKAKVRHDGQESLLLRDRVDLSDWGWGQKRGDEGDIGGEDIMRRKPIPYISGLTDLPNGTIYRSLYARISTVYTARRGEFVCHRSMSLSIEAGMTCKSF